MTSPTSAPLPQHSQGTGTGPNGDDEVISTPRPIYQSFWQNPLVQDLVPFLSSLFIHAMVIVLAVATYQGVKQFVTVQREQEIIPDAEITDGQIGGIPNPGLGGDPNKPAAQDQIADAPPESAGWSSSPKQTINNSLMGGGSDRGDETAISIGPGGLKGAGVGSGTGDGSGQLAIFGKPGGGGGIGPKSLVFGHSGNATRIAYVCDASGSMLGVKFDGLRIELRKAIDVLKPIQSFSIIFFADTQVLTAEQAMLIANPENKSKAFEFLNKTEPHGSTDPIPALKLAFEQRAQLIYLLTDGEFPDSAKVISYIREHNPGAKIKINTIAFVDRGEEYEKVLRQIARDSGGVFKYVSNDDLKQ